MPSVTGTDAAVAAGIDDGGGYKSYIIDRLPSMAP